MGPLAGATHHGVDGVPGDGPYAELWLRVEGGRIQAATYRTYGCPSMIACCGVVTEVLVGRTLLEASSLSAADVEVMVRPLPEGKGDCPERVVGALRSALSGQAGELVK